MASHSRPTRSINFSQIVRESRRELRTDLWSGSATAAGEVIMSTALIDEKEVFNTARRIAAEERVAFVQGACGGDPVAVERILELLRVYDQEQSFLEGPVLQPQATTDESLSERPGTLIGPYK